MRFTDLLTPNRIVIEPSIRSKKGLFDFISQTLSQDEAPLPAKALLKALHQREELGTTGIGQQIAIPHARLEGITAPAAVFIKLENGINYEAADDLPVKLVFAFVVPDGDNQTHLNIIASLVSVLQDETIRDDILALQNQQCLVDYLMTIEENQYAQST